MMLYSPMVTYELFTVPHIVVTPKRILGRHGPPFAEVGLDCGVVVGFSLQTHGVGTLGTCMGRVQGRGYGRDQWVWLVVVARCAVGTWLVAWLWGLVRDVIGKWLGACLGDGGL